MNTIREEEREKEEENVKDFDKYWQRIVPGGGEDEIQPNPKEEQSNA